ncbi:MAG: helix-turn-helix transcriptional regulator [Chloroflexi bacterium]|nr:helix-turn-helix transcriptional regulator [Chloroflexota bacterium]
MLARGLTNREIGSELDISLRTVQMHVAQIVAKMAAHSRTDAAIRAAKLSEHERETQMLQR